MSPTIVIVGYRAYAELEQCLASLAAHEPDVPVVVVDHAADEARGRGLAAAFPRVTYLPRRENPGFAAGVNYAARHAGPGPLLLLNPDCQIAGPIVAPLVDVLAAHPEAGVVGGLIREGDGALQQSARRFPDITTALGGRTSWLSRVAPDNPLTRRNLTTAPADGVVPVDWVSGAFMLIRRETFDQVRRLRRGVLPLLGGRRLLQAGRRRRLDHAVRAGRRGAAPDGAGEPPCAGAVAAGLSPQRVPLLLEARVVRSQAGRAGGGCRTGGPVPAAPDQTQGRRRPGAPDRTQ